MVVNERSCSALPRTRSRGSRLSSSSSRGALVARRESERVATARARPTTARRVEWTTIRRAHTGTLSGGGRRTGTRARSGSRSAPTYAEHGRLQRILRSLGLGRVWFCVVFSKLNTPRQGMLWSRTHGPQLPYPPNERGPAAICPIDLTSPRKT